MFLINKSKKLEKKFEKLFNAQLISSKGSAEFFKNFSVSNVYNFMLFINRDPDLKATFLGGGGEAEAS